MTRVISLYLPTWSTDRIRKRLGKDAPPVETPLVVCGREGNRRIILATDKAAQAAGLRIGTMASRAQAMVANLVIHEANLSEDAAALGRLALWALRRYAPVVATDLPDGLVINTTGADHLFGGEGPMLRDMLERIGLSGFSVRGAIASSWGAAHALARYGRRSHTVIPESETTAAISALPVSALRISPKIASDLHKLGFLCISDLIAAPRSSLTLRFGPEIGRRLDQALAKVREPIVPIRPPELIEVRRAFPEPIGAAETIKHYIAELVEALSEALGAKGLGARRMDLVCYRVDNFAQAVRVGTSVPSRNIRGLTRLLTDKVETIEPGFGIEIMTLTATLAEPLPNSQIRSDLIEETERDVSELVDNLANRIGSAHIYRVSPVASDVPERSICRIPAMAPPTKAVWPKLWPRPSRLLAPPERIDTVALLPDHPPVTFTWRGNRHRVKCADGPERVFGEWWRRDAELAAVRDYFRVEDDTGERFWIYRAGDGESAETGSHQWFLHGIFG